MMMEPDSVLTPVDFGRRERNEWTPSTTGLWVTNVKITSVGATNFEREKGGGRGIDRDLALLWKLRAKAGGGRRSWKKRVGTRK